MTLTKNEIKAQKNDPNLQDIQNAYQLVMRDIHNRTNSEKKDVKLKKIEKEVHKLYRQTLS